MMTCRWKCHGQQSINPKTSKDMLLLDVRMPLKDGWWLIYVRLKSWDSCQHWEDDAEEEEACSSALRLFICHVLVTVGRLSAIIYETLSEKFSSGSLPLRTSGLPFICSSYLVSQKQSSLSFFFSTLRLFSAVAMRGPHSFNTSLSFEQSNHHQTSILYTWLYIYVFNLHAYARNDAQLKAITNLPAFYQPSTTKQLQLMPTTSQHTSHSPHVEARIQSTYVLGDR